MNFGMSLQPTVAPSLSSSTQLAVQKKARANLSAPTQTVSEPQSSDKDSLIESLRREIEGLESRVDKAEYRANWLENYVNGQRMRMGKAESEMRNLQCELDLKEMSLAERGRVVAKLEMENWDLRQELDLKELALAERIRVTRGQRSTSEEMYARTWI
jgi:septal ring factor EnvC (AmiA/AmiB activator)